MVKCVVAPIVVLTVLLGGQFGRRDLEGKAQATAGVILLGQDGSLTNSVANGSGDQNVQRNNGFDGSGSSPYLGPIWVTLVGHDK